MDLRTGEEVVTCAGGKCVVCRERIDPGKAVQLSKWTSRIRHIECLPKTDTRKKTYARRWFKTLSY